MKINVLLSVVLSYPRATTSKIVVFTAHV